jgi:hypothetical protein
MGFSSLINDTNKIPLAKRLISAGAQRSDFFGYPRAIPGRFAKKFTGLLMRVDKWYFFGIVAEVEDIRWQECAPTRFVTVRH